MIFLPINSHNVPKVLAMTFLYTNATLFKKKTKGVQMLSRSFFQVNFFTQSLRWRLDIVQTG